MAFLVFMLIIAWWALVAFMERSSVELPAKVFWLKMGGFGSISLPVAMLVFTLRYTNREKWVTRRNIAILSILPVVSLTIILTNDIHHLWWKEIWLDTSLSYPMVAFTRNVWFYVMSSYSYSLILLGTLSLFIAFLQSTGIYRKQAGVILFPMLISWAANFLFIAGIGPFSVFNPMSLTYIITSVMWYWGVTLFHVPLDIVPIAHRAIFTSMVDAVIVLDTQQRIRELNQAAEHIFGRTSADTIGQPLSRVLPEQAGLAELQPEMTRTETEIVLGEGKTQIYYRAFISPILTQGRLNGYLLILHDDTERRKAESESRERVRLEAELIERKRAEGELWKRSHDLGERVKELKGLYGTSQLIVDPNITLDEVFQRTVDLIPPSWQYPDITCARITFEGKQFATANWKKSGWMQSADIVTKKRKVGVIEVGYLEEKPEIDEGPFLKEERDLMNGLARILGDYIERKWAEEELEKHREHLEELVEERTLDLEAANKELKAFSYSVSHDLRAPLRALDGFTGILIEDYASKLDEEGKRLGSIIQRNAKKMGKLIDDLLAFSRLGRTSMTSAKIDMKNMVKAMYHEATSAKERKRIKFNIAKLVPIEGDPNLMRQVWMNLISNAVKFSSQRKQAIISVSCVEGENKVTYCIKDNGAGFNMKYEDKLFGVFQRLHSETDFKGTGVGLALVQRIIRRHNGNIWAEGKVDKGALFYFSLPTNKG
jgi:PAS domain S-box-containing protein